MPAKIKVFVHLAENKDAGKWRQDYMNGRLVGRNDITPYGYGRAAAFDCDVTFSKNDGEGLAGKILRYGWRLLLGFDLVHAWRNRQRMLASDVVWTHTESQLLAVSAVLPSDGTRRPRIIGQSVWLIDGWSTLFPLRRAFYRRLIDKVDVLTFLSPENRDIARRLFPQKRAEFVKFGLVTENVRIPSPQSPETIRIISVGNDRHRDWETVAAAVRGKTRFRLRIASSNAGKYAADNIVVKAASTNDELNQAYAEAHVAVICLKPNFHASGITAVLEGVLAGLPVIATDTGGLRAYFGEDEVTYVPVGDPAAVAEAIGRIMGDPERSHRMALKAQEKAIHHISADDYIRDHVALSRELLGKDPLPVTAAGG